MKKFIEEQAILIGLVILVIIFSLLTDNFLTVNNISNLLRQVSINGIIAIGMTLVILLGGIDLSVGSAFGLVTVIFAILVTNNIPIILAIIIILIIGAILGLVNGFLIARFKLQPFIVTLATMSVYYGLVLVITNGNTITYRDNSAILNFIANGKLLIFFIPTIIMFILYIGFEVVLRKTVFGRRIYAVGSNEQCSRLVGINTNFIKMVGYMLAGLLVAVAAIILFARLKSAQPTTGVGYELDAIAAVVIGGTSLSGGRGRLYNSLIGAIIIGVISNGLNIIGISPDYQEIIKGLIIILAVIIDRKSNK